MNSMKQSLVNFDAQVIGITGGADLFHTTQTEFILISLLVIHADGSCQPCIAIRIITASTYVVMQDTPQECQKWGGSHIIILWSLRGYVYMY